MYLGAELLTRRDISLNLGHFFETWFSCGGEQIRRSLGRDEYHTLVSLRKGIRVAATGRIHLCQLDIEAVGLGLLQAPACRAVTVSAGKAPIFLNVRTNTALETTALVHTYEMKISREGQEAEIIRFDDPTLETESITPGRYLVNLSRIITD